MSPERPQKDQLREHVSREVITARQDVVQQQTILRELNIKLGTARKNLKLAGERLNKATLHLQQVENGTYQPPLFDHQGGVMPARTAKAARQSLATGTLSHGPKGPVPS